MGQLSVLQQQQQESGCVVWSDALLDYFGFQRPFAVSVALLLAYWLVLHVATVGALMRLASQEQRYVEMGWPDIHWLARDLGWAGGSHCVSFGQELE